MAGLAYVGPTPSVTTDTSRRDYTEAVAATGFTSTQVDSAINTIYNAYGDKSYADTRDGLLATRAYIDAQDNLRLKLAQRNAVNGVAGLDATGRVPANRISSPSTQRWPHGPWSPSAYHGSPLVATTEATLYSTTITDPGFAYKVVVFGILDANMTLGDEYPRILVRDGSTSGPIVAGGNGFSDNLLITDGFEYADTSLNTTDWTQLDFSGTTGAGTIGADGHNAYYNQITTSALLKSARRANPVDAVTSGDYQEITTTLATVQSGAFPTNQFFLRTNSGFFQYVRCIITLNQVEWHYAVGFGDSSPQASASNFTQSVGDEWKFIAGADGQPRKYDFLKNGVSVVPFYDGLSATLVGPSNRSWGIGMGTTLGGVTAPAKLSSITMDDGTKTTPNYGPVRIIPQNLHTQSSRTGATTLYVRVLRSGTAGTATFSTFMPKLHVLAVPA